MLENILPVLPDAGKSVDINNATIYQHSEILNTVSTFILILTIFGSICLPLLSIMMS